MKTIFLLGCGKMGRALVKGWLKSNEINKIIIIEPVEQDFSDLKDDKTKIVIYKSIKHLASYNIIDVLVLAVKPQKIENILLELKPLSKKFKLIISIIAGIKIDKYEKYLGKSIPIIRAMPNTPASEGEGITAIVKNKICNQESFEYSRLILKSIGEVVSLNTEFQIDAVTAVSGSGPAYFFYFVEALINAAKKLGLEDELAYKLAISTFIGSGILAKNLNQSLVELRKSVTSPGGTTEAGIKKLIENDNLFKILENAVQSAHQRSIEIGNK